MSVIHYTEAAYKRDCEERNAAFKAKHGREMNYEDVLLSFGGQFVGHSINSPLAVDPRDGGDLQVESST